eukprot:4809312-Pleurochrysis_carterae.AAC.2
MLSSAATRSHTPCLPRLYLLFSIGRPTDDKTYRLLLTERPNAFVHRASMRLGCAEILLGANVDEFRLCCVVVLDSPICAVFLSYGYGYYGYGLLLG